MSEQKREQEIRKRLEARCPYCDGDGVELVQGPAGTYRRNCHDCHGTGYRYPVDRDNVRYLLDQLAVERERVARMSGALNWIASHPMATDPPVEAAYQMQARAVAALEKEAKDG